MTGLLFTIGHHESYERYFREQGQPEKLGRRRNLHGSGRFYPGGSVFETFAAAQLACPYGYRPYGLLTTLANTYVRYGHRHLIKDAVLCRLDDQGKAVEAAA